MNHNILNLNLKPDTVNVDEPVRRSLGSLLVAERKSSKEVAQTLTRADPSSPIDHRTVENHRAKIFDKLELANSNELLVFLRDNGR